MKLLHRIFPFNTTLAVFSLFLWIPNHGSAVIIYSGVQDQTIAQGSGDSLQFAIGGIGDTVALISSPFGSFNLGLPFRDPSLDFRTVSHNEFALVQGLGFGEPIDASSNWDDARVLARYGDDDTAPEPRGDFFDQTDMFLALEVSWDEEMVFAWMRISHSPEAEQLTVHDWGWNSAPGEPIMAGQVPEPAAYAAVFGGGVLLFALLRRFRVKRGRGSPFPAL